MKIEKIDENKLKVVLSFEDILKLNLDITEISPESEVCGKIFNDMLTLASQEYGFAVDNSRLMIEAMPSYKEGFVMFVSKVEKVEKVEEKAEICAVETKEKLLVEIFKFGSLGILNYAIGILDRKTVVKFRAFLLDGLFYMILYKNCHKKTELTMTLISDFGLKISMPEIFEGVLNEYGREISLEEMESRK